MSTPVTGTYALLTDGGTVEVRPARRQDAEAVRAMHAAMSEDNMYLRFFSMSPAAGEQEARRVCREPDPYHAALLAWQDGRVVGVGTYEPAGKPGVAEVAFAVADDMHGRGIASLLLEHLVWRARQHGVRAFTAETLAENSAMLRVFADAGLPAKRRIVEGTVELTFPLPGDDDTYRLGHYLEAVASRESRADVASLGPLLRPRSVAVVGASRRRGTVGRAILRNIVTGSFTGPVYAVNPHAQAMEGVPCVASVDDLPGPVDLAVVAVPPSAVPEVAEQCGRNGVRALIVISACRGAAGAELLAVCRRYGMRLVGPSCLGVIVPWIGLDATFAAGHPVRGVAGLMVQSGGVGIALLEQLSRLGIGVSSFASAGDKYDVSPTDLLTWWAQDEVTQIAVLYVESFGNPRKFAGTASRVAQRMPVLTVVGARSPAGHRAASHTAAAATPVVNQEAMFGRAGVIATTSLGELVDTIALLACQPLPAGNRVAIIANAGGAAALAADACADHGLQVVQLGAATQHALRRLLPAAAVVTGPVDTSPVVTTQTFRACVEEVAADNGVDVVLAVAVPTAFSDLSAAVAEAVISKPLAVALLDRAESVTRLKRRPIAQPPPGPHADTAPADAPPAAHPVAVVIDVAAAAVTGVPCYADPGNAARALGHAVRYRAWRGRQRGQVPELEGLRAADARALVTGFLSRLAGRRLAARSQRGRPGVLLRRPAGGHHGGGHEGGSACGRCAVRRPRRAQGRGRGAGAQDRRRGRQGRSAHPAGSGRGLPDAGGRLRAAAAAGACPADAGRRRRGAHRRGAGACVRAAGGVRARRRGHRGARRSHSPADPADRRRRRRDDPRRTGRATAGRRPGHAAGGHRRARGRAAAGLPASR